MKRFFLCVVFMAFQCFISAQETKNTSQNSIKDMFDFVMTSSNNYQDHKVVKRELLNNLKIHVLDSIQSQKSKITLLNDTIYKERLKVSALENELALSKAEILKINTDKDVINFLGMDIKKDSFKNIFWGISVILVILLTFFMFRCKSSNMVTKETKSLLADIEKEFEEHRRNALEREQKVMRKLQDELNKNKASI